MVTHPNGDNPDETIFNDSVAELAGKHATPVLVRENANDAEVAARIEAVAPEIFIRPGWAR